MCNVYSKDDLTCFYWSAAEFTYIIPIHDPYVHFDAYGVKT